MWLSLACAGGKNKVSGSKQHTVLTPVTQAAADTVSKGQETILLPLTLGQPETN